ncbi:MAG TPA: cupredoxin domain-containing protein [Thermoanaerobaculia bacterium]|nr:cupredoxin domain-containing protein [Thermoanaerobaculia bacterium]
MRTGITIAAIVFASACQPGPVDQSQNTPSQSTTMAASETAATETSTMNPVLPPETDDPAARPKPAGPTQEVHLIEYQIHMPQSVPAGPVAFNVENGGKEDHAFEIEGNGVHQQTTVLKRGDTTALEVNLKPGTYTVYCPVDGHKGKGMQTTLVVK